jgi:hypothetical protein
MTIKDISTFEITAHFTILNPPLINCHQAEEKTVETYLYKFRQHRS